MKRSALRAFAASSSFWNSTSMPPSLILSHLTTFPNLSQPSRRWNGESEEKGFSLLRKMITLGTRLSCLTKVRPSVSTDGREAAEAEARGVGFPLRDSMKKECSFGPRFPTHPGAQLGDGPHSPVGWWAARITAGLYGSQNAKSSRTKPPDTRPRGQPKSLKFVAPKSRRTGPILWIEISERRETPRWRNQTTPVPGGNPPHTRRPAPLTP